MTDPTVADLIQVLAMTMFTAGAGVLVCSALAQVRGR